ncbi:MAG: amidohydrolase family protein [Nitrospirae bacterium]|nr:amidohydrolase family protein [Nitrospirota bacterium]
MKIKNIIDLHTHGIGRYDTKTNKPEDILNMAGLHAKAGVSAILPTIYSGSIVDMRKNMETVKKAMEAQKSGGWGQGIELNSKLNLSLVTCYSSLILGVHLEGPFFNPLRCGAQDKAAFIKPTIPNLKKLIDGYEDIVKIITLAPELPGALKVIEHCASLGIRVNLGHSDATYKQALDGKKAGAKGVTHLFNAMRPFHHREPGLTGFGLLDKDIYIEVIADGVHINSEVLKMIFKIKPLDRILLVSDSIKGADNKKTAKLKKQGVLKGGLTTITQAVRNLKNLGIPKAAVMQTAVDNPKRYLP